ncbi:hypothetical protein Tco_0016694 [Tanacetum coccineum]
MDSHKSMQAFSCMPQQIRPSSTDAFVLPLSTAGDLACSGASQSSTVAFALPSSLVSYSGASSTYTTLTVVSTTHTPDL